MLMFSWVSYLFNFDDIFYEIQSSIHDNLILIK